MNNLYLDGLITARKVVASKGVEALDRLIEEIKSHSIETTAVEIVAETR